MNKERQIKAIVTMPPYAPHIEEVLKHPGVIGIRLNTVMPFTGSLEDLLKSLNEKALSEDKKLWVDLKCRQLRVKEFGIPPFTEITLSHDIELNTPVKAYFSDRTDYGTVLIADGNKLIMQEGPKKVIGPGESVTITDPSLKIKGYLTDLDKRYIECGNKAGIKDYMLSFVEEEKDTEEFRKYDSASSIVAKIESKKGLDYILNKKDDKVRLMAARGDLFMQFYWPHEILGAVGFILKKDKEAIVASRILESMAYSQEPSCSDLGDLDNLLRMGYDTIMFGDEVCLKRNSIIGALNLFGQIKKNYERRGS